MEFDELDEEEFEASQEADDEAIGGSGEDIEDDDDDEEDDDDEDVLIGDYKDESGKVLYNRDGSVRRSKAQRAVLRAGAFQSTPELHESAHPGFSCFVCTQQWLVQSEEIQSVCLVLESVQSCFNFLRS